MKDEDFNIRGYKKRVLVAPLDWGLGHATRCIPIIFKLQEQNCEVIIAAEGAVKILLEKEFPGLLFINLKGYRVRYSRSKRWMPVKLFLQLPKLVLRIYSEKRWLKKMVRQHRIDAVISDNRLGLSHTNIPSVYITHQLTIKTGSGFTEKLVQKIHYHFINNFTSCWVPDAEGTINLAGDLSHPKILPNTPVEYLGPLSRFEKTDSEIIYDLCIILSGPEPQRSVFESQLLKELKHFIGKAILVRALPGDFPAIESDQKNLEIKNHLPAQKLSLVLQQSAVIISRSGYTTIMDLAKLGKKAILVPTPGQTEQQYIAGYLHDLHFFCSVVQEGFSLHDALKKLNAFNLVKIPLQQNAYEKVVTDFVQRLLK